MCILFLILYYSTITLKIKITKNTVLYNVQYFYINTKQCSMFLQNN